MKTVATNTNIKIPLDVAICPICGADVYVDIDEWEQNEDGTWKVSDCGVHCNCTTEPAIATDEWEEWFYGHWSMPYVDWLPVDEKVRVWLIQNYRFDIKDESK